MKADETKEKQRPFLKQWYAIAALLMSYDLICACFSYFSALFLRFDMKWSQIPANYIDIYQSSILIYALFCVIVFYIMKLYSSIWRFAGYTELVRTVTANIFTVGIQILLTLLIFKTQMPLSYYVWGAVFQLILTAGIRFSYRFIKMKKVRQTASSKYENIMLIGAGNAGQMILRDINEFEHDGHSRVVCIIDDNPNKWNRYIDGIPVTGGRENIPEAVKKYNIKKIFLTVPSASAAQKKEILNICMETGCEVKQLPGVTQMIEGNVTVSSLKHVSAEDLLGREPIHIDLDEVFHFLKGKTILVTGGGGSIGSELCRQIAKHQPEKLIIFDIYENNAYLIQLELREKYPDLDLIVLIGSVRDSRKLFRIFEQYHPEVVYHAAAHKHVPLMEDSPCEAIKNNTIGTYKTAYAAMVYGCERFVLISTDKAVNPTSVMGVSKRLCEMIIQSFDAKIKAGQAEQLPQLFTHDLTKDFTLEKNNAAIQEALRHAKTEYVAVRFGNVLNSNGSVIPVFEKQIEHGGPVTVTHPDIIRYFMTISEAVSLVLLAGTYAKGGEIFVLDLGSPVKIDTLARNLIRLSGHIPDIDIKIEYTGLRPGEKLYEEVLMAEEGLQKTQNNLIYIGQPIPFDTDEFLHQLRTLMDMAYRNINGDEMRNFLHEIVPTYQNGGE